MADPTPCAHERITTARAEGLPSLWYCDDCRRRFYPACETCVDVGHRNETHVQPTPEAGLREAANEACRLWFDEARHEDEQVMRAAMLALRAALAAPAPDGWRLCPTGYVPEDHAVRLCKCAAPAPDDTGWPYSPNQPHAVVAVCDGCGSDVTLDDQGNWTHTERTEHPGKVCSCGVPGCRGEAQP